MPAAPPTFEQLKVFIAVVEEGGFSAAARRLNRRQSVISYTISNLEDQLGGVPLFDRTTRRPTLTDAGRAVLANARTIAAGMDQLCARINGLQSGLEAEIALVVDVMMPMQLLVGSLADFHANFPAVGLRLHVETLGGVATRVLDGTCTIGISGPLFYAVDGLDQCCIGSTSLIPVAAPSHSLAQGVDAIPSAMARKHTQLVLADRSRLSEGRDFAVLAADTWRVSDLGVKHALLLAGVGWGNMPAAAVDDDIRAGRLVPLPLAEWRKRPYPLYAVHRAQKVPGPAACWLIKRISQEAALIQL